MSLRRRVVLGFVVVAAVLVGTNALVASRLHTFLLDRVDRQLVDVASRPMFRGERVPRLRPVRPRRPGASPIMAPAVEPALPGDGGLPGADAVTEYFIAQAPAGAPSLTPVGSVLATGDEDYPPLDRARLVRNIALGGATLVPYTVASGSGQGEWRVVASQNPRDGRVVVVGISLAELDATLARIRLVQVAGTLAVLTALGLVSWWMVRLGVHPVAAMARTADAIAAGDLSHRVGHVDQRTEAGRLGAAMNAMLGRIEEAFGQREASEARVRRFAADASHELRTPLTSIQGYTELWRAGGLRDAGELAEAMRRMEEEARRMGALVEDLLLLARLDEGRRAERRPVALDVLAADSVRDARAIEPGRPITLDAAPVAVEGDEAQLRQVLANLLANARLHTPPDAAVLVTVSRDANVARLVVADSGPGLRPEAAAKVFERFYRADPSRGRNGGGSGLGLSIVAAIASAHGGQTSVHSEPGKGAAFTVELPASDSVPSHPSAIP